MVTVPHIMVSLERMLDYRGALARFHRTITITLIGANDHQLQHAKPQPIEAL